MVQKETSGISSGWRQIALALVHLSTQELLPDCPEGIEVLDLTSASSTPSTTSHITSRCPKSFTPACTTSQTPCPVSTGKLRCLRCQPSVRASNDGNSVAAFIQPGIEAVPAAAFGCIVIGDHRDYPWTHNVQLVTRTLLLAQESGTLKRCRSSTNIISTTTLNLSLCGVVERQAENRVTDYASEAVSQDKLANFYGGNSPLKYHYVRD